MAMAADSGPAQSNCNKLNSVNIPVVRSLVIRFISWKAGTIIKENRVFLSWRMLKRQKIEGFYTRLLQWNVYPTPIHFLWKIVEEARLLRSITWFTATPTRAHSRIFPAWSRLAPGWPQLNCGEIRSLEQWRKRFICPWIRQSLCRRVTIVEGDHTTRNSLAAHFAWTTRA